MTKPPRDPGLDLARKYAHGGRVGYAEGGPAEEITRDLLRDRQRRAMAGLELSPLEKARLDLYMKDLPNRRELKSREIDELGAVAGMLPDPRIVVRREGAPDAGPDLRRRAQDMAMRGMEPDRAVLDAYLERLPERREMKATEMDEGASALRAAQESAPFAFGPIGRGIGSALGKAASYITSNPLKSAGLAAGLGLFGNPATAGDPKGGPSVSDNSKIIQDLYQQRSTLEQRRTDADAELQKARREMARQEKTGRGPLYNDAATNLASAEAKYKSLSSDLSAVTAMLSSETEKNTPEYRRKQEELDRKAADDAAKVEANKTFREAHPYWNAALLPMGIAGAIGLPYVGKTVAQRVRNTPINRMNQTVAATDDAIAARDVGKISDLTPRLQAYKKGVESGEISANPTRGENLMGFAGSTLGGGAIGAETRMFPSQYDAAMLPDDNPLKEEARKRQFDPLLYLEGMLPGALMAGSMHWKLPVNKAVPRTQDIDGILKKYGTTPERAESALTRSAGNMPTTPLQSAPGPMGPSLGSPTFERLPPPTAIGPSPALEGPTVRPLRSPEAVANLENAASKASDRIKQSKSELPEWGIPAPEGVKVVKGGIIHKDTGRVHMKDGTWGPAPRYTMPKKPLTEGKQGKKYLEADDVPKKPDRVPEDNDPGFRRYGGPAGDPGLELARKYADGGKVVPHGLMGGATGGRTDALPISVPNGAFIVPADVVSATGEGNTMAGAEAFKKMLPPPRSNYAAGGGVPIRISDGEIIVSPDQVAEIGGGSLEAGHAKLDALVRKIRADHIKTLKSLPGPAQG